MDQTRNTTVYWTLGIIIVLAALIALFWWSDTTPLTPNTGTQNNTELMDDSSMNY